MFVSAIKAQKPRKLSGRLRMNLLFTEQEYRDWFVGTKDNKNQETYSNFVHPEQAVRLLRFHPLATSRMFHA
jgi:hypothetical protein